MGQVIPTVIYEFMSNTFNYNASPQIEFSKLNAELRQYVINRISDSVNFIAESYKYKPNCKISIRYIDIPTIMIEDSIVVFNESDKFEELVRDEFISAISRIWNSEIIIRDQQIYLYNIPFPKYGYIFLNIDILRIYESDEIIKNNENVGDNTRLLESC